MNIAIAIPAATVAVGAVLFGVWRSLRLVFRIDRALPVLLRIADEFENNGGSTLKDRLDSIDIRIDDQGRRTDVRFAKLEGMLLGTGITPPTVA